jgi:hypothetical protein
MFFLAGEAGIGKSRLLAEIRGRGLNEGFLALRGDCFESDLTFPYAPLIDGLRLFFASRSPSDGRVTLEMEIAEGDLVAGYETWRGTHTGEFFGIPASGRPVTFKVNDIIRVANGKIVEHWAVTDNLSLMQQIGAIPEPDEAGI